MFRLDCLSWIKLVRLGLRCSLWFVVVVFVLNCGVYFTCDLLGCLIVLLGSFVMLFDFICQILVMLCLLFACVGFVGLVVFVDFCYCWLWVLWFVAVWVLLVVRFFLFWRL